MKQFVFMVIVGLLTLSCLSYILWLDISNFSINKNVSSPDFLRDWQMTGNLEVWSIVLSLLIGLIGLYLAFRLALNDYTPNIEILLAANGAFIIQNQSKGIIKIESITQKQKAVSPSELVETIYRQPKLLWTEMQAIEGPIFTLNHLQKRRVLGTLTHITTPSAVESSFAWVVSSELIVKSLLGVRRFRFVHAYVSSLLDRQVWARSGDTLKENTKRTEEVVADSFVNNQYSIPVMHWELTNDEQAYLGYRRDIIRFFTRYSKSRG